MSVGGWYAFDYQTDSAQQHEPRLLLMMPWKAVCKVPLTYVSVWLRPNSQKETNGKWQCRPGAIGYVKSLGLDRVTTHKASIYSPVPEKMGHCVKCELKQKAIMCTWTVLRRSCRKFFYVILSSHPRWWTTFHTQLWYHNLLSINSFACGLCFWTHHNMLPLSDAFLTSLKHWYQVVVMCSKRFQGTVLKES